MPGILRVAIIEIKDKVFDVFGILEMKINSWTYCSNLVFLELLQVMGEVVATDPDLMEITLFIQHFLATIIVTSLTEGKHSFS